MATTVEKTATVNWQAVASGAGNVTVTAQMSGARWAVTPNATAPTLARRDAGHVLEKDRDVSMALLAGERLWIRGAGNVYVTADLPL